MDFKLVNLTSIFVQQEIEYILSTYPKDPYQIAFSISYWRQRLIAYILNNLTNRYIVIQTKHHISRASNLLQFPIEDCLAIENLIKKAIIRLLQDNPNWQDYQFSVQDKPIDDYNLNGKTDNQHLSIQYNNPDFYLTHTDDFLQQRLKEFEQCYREISLLNEISDFLQVCHNKIAVYQGLTKFFSHLFFKAKGGFFRIDSLNSQIESISTWGLDEQPFFINRDLWALDQKYVHQISKEHPNILDDYIHQQLEVENYICISIASQDKILELLYIKTELPTQLTLGQQQLAYSIAKKIALTISNLELINNLQQQTIRDPLTDLFNRRYLDESLEREIDRANRTQSSIVILLIDIDNFKNINDTFGHQLGDILLQKIAQCLQKNSRKSDIICRYGGDEFLLIFPNASLVDIHYRVEQIRQEVQNLEIYEAQNNAGLMVKISVGVACFPTHGKTPTSLILQADRALCSAKQQGRNLTVTAPFNLLDES